MKKAPSIRFREFSDDWEQRKVGDFLTVSRIPGHTGLDARKLTVKLWGKGIVEKTDSNSGSENTQYYIRHAGQFMYGKLDFLHAAFGIVPENLDGYESTHDLPAFDLNGIDGHFILNRVTQEDFFLKLGMIANGTRKAKRIHEDTFMDMPITVPMPSEQTRIGEFFISLDNIITLQQKKYEQMESVLLSMREKLFAKQNAPFPENRFSGFNGDWEICSMRDIVFPYSDPVPTPHDGYERLGIRSHGKGTFYSYVGPGAELETAQMHKVAANKMIVNITFAWEHAVAVTDENDAGKLVSHRFPQFSLSEGLHPRFLHYLILDERFRHHLFLASPGGAGRNRVLKIDEMMEYQVRIPRYEEQEKIADFLDSLVELTQLYAMRLEKLKNIKAACLEGMFV